MSGADWFLNYRFFRPIYDLDWLKLILEFEKTSLTTLITSLRALTLESFFSNEAFESLEKWGLYVLFWIFWYS